MYDLAYLEISGACNARCPLCPTWRRKPEFIDTQDFSRAIEHMLKTGMIGPNSRIGLYNWGEPMLHPQFQEIVAIMSILGVQFGLSTNASICQTFKRRDALVGLRPMKFSMCGFSQASYDKVQGRDFGIVKQNIATMIANYRDCGFHSEAYVLFHVYQFNLDEIEPAREWSESLGITFFPYYAHFNHVPLTIDYLTGRMLFDLALAASSSMVLTHLPRLLRDRPNDYQCPEHNRLVIDERLNVRTCCVCPPHDERYYLGKLLDMTEEQIQSNRMQPICKECLATGAAYWMYEGQRKCPVINE